MAKITRILFVATHYDGGVPKYEAGKHYSVTEETSRSVMQGHAELIEVDMKIDKDGQTTIDAANAEKIAELRTSIEIGNAALVTAQKALDENKDPKVAERLANAVVEVKNNLKGLGDQLVILEAA